MHHFSFQSVSDKTLQFYKDRLGRFFLLLLPLNIRSMFERKIPPSKSLRASLRNRVVSMFFWHIFYIYATFVYDILRNFFLYSCAQTHDRGNLSSDFKTKYRNLLLGVSFLYGEDILHFEGYSSTVRWLEWPSEI